MIGTGWIGKQTRATGRLGSFAACVMAAMALSAYAAGQTATGAAAASIAAATPGIATTPAQHGAVIVSLSDSTAGETIYYTTDGSTPTTSSPRYEAPFLVDSDLTVKALAAANDGPASAVATQTFATKIPAGTLVWSDEFNDPVASKGQPNPAVWTWDVGTNCCGNHEPETYCAWGSSAGPCTPAHPNASIGTDGSLHIVALNPAPKVYTSARLKSQGLFSFQYGRVEARMRLPESQGMWPAFWMLGNNIKSVGWPASGEADILEHIDGHHPPLHAGGKPQPFDWVQSSVHGTDLNGGKPYTAPGFSAAQWHTYGMIWKKGEVQYYIDDPSHPYETFTPADFTGTWPFDQGPMFLLLNLAVGGDWPGNPDATTKFPGVMLVDYVRVYTN